MLVRPTNLGVLKELLQAERAMPWTELTKPMSTKTWSSSPLGDAGWSPGGSSVALSSGLVEESGKSEFTSWHGLLVANDLKPGHLIGLSLCVLTGKMEIRLIKTSQ